MKRTLWGIVLSVLTSTAKSDGLYHTWHGPSKNDSRGPCPMLNTLANHEFLPHNGRAFTLRMVKDALKTALNVSEDLSELLHYQALKTNRAPNATTWGLDTLSIHNILEHDASLSRSDKFFTNDAVTFNASVYEQTSTWWPSDTINVQMIADARLGRLIDSVKYNREFASSELAGAFSAGEGAALLLFFGNGTGTGSKELIDYFFRNERLPIEFGWTPPNPVVTKEELFDLSERIIEATVYKPDAMGKLANP